MRHWRESDERLAGTGRQRRARALLREAVQRPGVPEVTKVYEDWKRAERAVDSHRTIARSRGFFANRTDVGEIG